MTCNEVQDLMAAYVTDKNEITDAKADWISKHIQACPVCHAWYQEVLELSAIWAAEGNTIAGLDLVEPVMHKLEAAKPSHGVSAEETVKIRYAFSRRTVFYHYGIAASMAFVLFHFGVFENVGLDLSQTGIFLSQKLQALAQHVSSF